MNNLDRWSTIQLKNIGVWTGGGTPSKDNRAFWEEGTVPWVSPKDMKVTRIKDTENRITTAAIAASSTRLVAAGSVAIVVRSGILAHTLPVAVTDVPVTLNQDLKAVTPHEGIDPAYFAWTLRRHAKKVLDLCKKDGTTVASIDTNALGAYEIPLAPTNEQLRIVETIETFVSQLDAAVAVLERAQAKLKAYRASVLKAAVEGRLAPTEAELARAAQREYEHANVLLERILAERRHSWEEAELSRLTAAGKRATDDKWKAKYQEPTRAKTKELPQLPEGWCWATVDQLIDGARRLGYGVLVPGPDVPGGVPLIRVGDIQDGTVISDRLKRIDRSIADIFSKTYVQGGEVIISLVGTIGRTAVVPAHLAGANVARAVGVMPTSSLLEAKWIEIYFRSPNVRHKMAGLAHEVARKTLNLEDVRRAVVALPPLAEQQRIAVEVDDLDSVAVAILRSIKHQMLRISRLRQAILKWAFEGKLVDQDPNDEPADKLLERIRAKRAADEPVKKTARRRKTKAAE